MNRFGFAWAMTDAQTGDRLALSAGMWPDHLVAVSALFLLAPPSVPHSAASAQARVTLCDAPTFSLPASIELEEGLEPIVRWALEYSPTFRQQCRVLFAHPTLTAAVTVRARHPALGTRARAVFRERASGGLDARIEIADSTVLTELLGHEFEHVIERLDGVDLRALTRQGEARQLNDGAFETKRAILAGQRVAAEVVNNAPDRVRHTTGLLWRAVRRFVRAAV